MVPSLNLVPGLLVNGLGLPNGVIMNELPSPGLSGLNRLEGDKTGLLVLAVWAGDRGGVLGGLRRSSRDRSVLEPAYSG